LRALGERAQVSFDYLIVVTFAVALTVVVAALVTVIEGISNDAQSRVLVFRDKTLASLLS
jgi:hypothetical protein